VKLILSQCRTQSICGRRVLLPFFRNPGARMEVSVLIRPLVVALRGGKISGVRTLNKIGREL
jgi:hypothetical protein